jgi:peptidoglycan hydrolase-like protein with peptidoglycan-binding domain
MSISDTVWGRASAKTFRKLRIRQVRLGNCSVLVHISISDLVAEALRVIHARGIELPETIPGWVPYQEGLTPQEYGLAFEPGHLPDDLHEPLLDLGFTVSDDVVAFSLGIQEAGTLSNEVETARVRRLAPNLPKDPDAWQTHLPGERTLKAGCKGDDVQFVQYALGCDHTDGVYNPETTQTVMLLQRMYNLRQTGIMDDNAWMALLPTTSRYDISYGDSGSIVRVLQAALAAYDWDDEVLVTGRFDQITLRAVKHLQDTFGLRTSGVMGAPEWAVLLGRPVRRVG